MQLIFTTKPVEESKLMKNHVKSKRNATNGCENNRLRLVDFDNDRDIIVMFPENMIAGELL